MTNGSKTGTTTSPADQASAPPTQPQNQTRQVKKPRRNRARGDRFLNWQSILLPIVAVVALFAFLVTAYFRLQDTNRQFQTDGQQSPAWQLNQVQVKLLRFINVLDRVFLPQNSEIGFIEVQDSYEQLLVDIDRALVTVEATNASNATTTVASLNTLREDLDGLKITVSALEFTPYREVAGIRLRMEGHATRIQRLPIEALQLQSSQMIRVQQQVSRLTTQIVIYILAILLIAAFIIYTLVGVQRRAVEFQNYLITALNTIPDAFALFDERDRLTVSNERFRQEFNLTPEEIAVEPTFRELLERDVRAGFYPNAIDNPTTWIHQRLNKHQAPSLPFQEPFGADRWVRVAERQTNRGETVMIQADITVLKNRETELFQSQSRFMRLVESSFDGILVVQNQRIISANERLAEILGFKTDEIKGQSFADVLDVIINQEDPANISGWGTLLQNRDADEVQVAARKKGGDNIFLEASVRTFDVEEGEEKVWAIRDITLRQEQELELRRAKEEAEQGNRAKTDFLAMMSHEIRTPMNAVLGMTNLILDTSLDARQQYYASTVRDSAEGLLTILNDMLDLTKLEAGKLVLERVAFDFGHVVQSIMDLMAPHAADKDLMLEAELSGLQQRYLVGDPQRLRQVLLNLVGNAIKFTESGGVRVLVDQDVSATQPGDAPVVSIRVSVIDTGIGISAEKTSQLFTPFTQADTDISRRFGGTGLGLAICKRIIDQMQGDITVTSREGEGSTFFFSIDFEVADASDVKTLEEDEGYNTRPRMERPGQRDGIRADLSASDPDLVIPGQSQNNGSRVLVVEDSPTNQAVVAAFLEVTDYQLTMAENGAEALRQVQAEPFDVVLMDVSMPVMDGLEATRGIRELQGRFAELPIIALTANAMPEDQKRCFDAGMNDYLSKPIEPALLLEKLRFWTATNRADADGVIKGEIDTDVDIQKPSNIVRIGEESDSAASGKVDDAPGLAQRQDNVLFTNPSVEDAELADIQESELEETDLVSTDVLQQLTEDTGPDIVTMLVKSYLDELQIHLQALEDALDINDQHQVRHRAHTIKGSSNTFGALRLGLAAKWVENACDDNNWTRAVEIAKSIPALANETDILMKAILEI